MRSYPKNWDAIAQRIKDKAHWRCERCGAPHEDKKGRRLTVAHLDMAYGDQAFNLAALCPACHLKMENTQAHRNFQFAQGYMFEHSDWMQPHVDGWERWKETRCAATDG